jgi:hypothetical protein
VTWQQQDPKRSERWLSAGLIVAFVVIIGGLAYVISQRSAPDEGGKATNTTKVEPPTSGAPSSSAAPKTTTLVSTRPPSTTTTIPTTTTRPTTSTAPTTAPPAGLFCRDLVARGYPYRDALAYWNANGRPARMDADGNGVPCETVYSAAAVAQGRAQARAG